MNRAGKICVIAFAILMLSLVLSLGHRHHDNQIVELVKSANPPAEVLNGQIQKVEFTTEYASDGTAFNFLVFTLCTGETWNAPSESIPAFEEWLKEGLAPPMSCPSPTPTP